MAYAKLFGLKENISDNEIMRLLQKKESQIGNAIINIVSISEKGVSGDFGDRSGNPWEISFVSSDVVVFKYLVLDPNLQNEAKELSSLLGESGFKLASGNTKVSSKGDVYELFGEGRNYDKSFFNDWLAAAKTFPKDKFTEVGYSHSMSGIVLNARRPNHNLVVSVPAAVQPNLDELLKGYSVQRTAANPMDGVQWYDHVGETMKRLGGR